MVPFWGITALSIENGSVSVRVFFSSSAAYSAHRQGVKALLASALADKMAWAWRDFSSTLKFPLEMR